GRDVVDPRADFLRELFDAERNPELVQLLADLRAKVARYIYGWRLEHNHESTHVKLLDAVEKGDEQLAVRLLLEGLVEVRNDILAAFTGSAQGRGHGRHSSTKHGPPRQASRP